MDTWKNINSKHIGQDFNEFLKEEGIKISMEDIFKNMSKKINKNSGVNKVHPCIIIGESERKYLEEQFGKEIVERYTKEGKIKWIQK